MMLATSMRLRRSSLSSLLADRRNTDLEDMIELLATLIEKYEQETFSFPQADPVQNLTHLMEGRDMTNSNSLAQLVSPPCMFRTC